MHTTFGQTVFSAIFNQQVTLLRTSILNHISLIWIIKWLNNFWTEIEYFTHSV